LLLLGFETWPFSFYAVKSDYNLIVIKTLQCERNAAGRAYYAFFCKKEKIIRGMHP
jgi:hypothetical protein